MVEYIDRDAAIEKLNEIIRLYVSENTFTGTFAAGVVCDIRDCIIEEIHAADAVPVVRCKDCKHQRKAWHIDKRMKDGGYWVYGCERNRDPFVNHTVDGLDDEFCPYGELKEGAE